MVKIDIKLLTITLILMTVFSTIVLAAIPGIPNAFYGTVTWNGQAAPDATIVTAKINGIEVANTTTSGGKYGFPPNVFYVEDPNNDRPGKTISFFVNDVDTGQTAIFTSGDWTELDLSAAGEQQTTTPGGGGGGGGVPQEPEEEETEETEEETTETTPTTCEEKWICEEWSSCVNGVQIRECNDENNCGTNNKEPFLSQPCSVEEIIEEKGIAGLFLLSLTDIVVGSVITLVLAVAIIYYMGRRGKKK